MGTEPSTLTSRGWEALPGEQVSKTTDSYRTFIQDSRAEICIPKHGYVAMRTGWVSDRQGDSRRCVSVCSNCDHQTWR